jgi:tRNA (cmo5U34)-methyltransferase
MTRKDIIWQNPEVARNFLEGVRGGIPYAADQLAIMLRLLAANERPLERFIDLGSGAGAVAGAVLTAFPEAQAILVDFSEPMLEQARAKLTGAQIVQADFSSRDWLEKVAGVGSVDAVVSAFAIHHATDERKKELYAEIYGLLRPGGFFINIEHVASATPWIEAQSDALMVDTMWAFHSKQGTTKTQEQVAADFLNRADKVANILALVEVQCEWLRTIGFGDVDCYFKSFELALFGGRRKG